MVIREKLRLGREESMTLHTRNEINRRARKALICDFSDAEKLRSQYEMDGESKPYGQWKSKRKREAGLRDLCAAPVFPADHSCGECAPGKNDRTGIYPAVPGYRKPEQSGAGRT